MTKNSKHLVRTICSQMKNKSLKLKFVTKNSKHLVGMICSQMKNTSVKLPFGTSGDDVSALVEFTVVIDFTTLRYGKTERQNCWLFRTLILDDLDDYSRQYTTRFLVTIPTTVLYAKVYRLE